MRVVYFSLTGNVRRFVKKLGFPSTELNQTNPFLQMTEPFVLIAPSYEKEVTDILWDFMDTNQMESFAQKFEHHQQDKRFHPFTCGNDACNQTHAHAELYYDELFDKLRCHYCDYEQDVPDYLEELLELL